ncbi:MAG: hypothetical protein GXP31_16595 [Kiritimatiellaeota bacterium]|nr:hypothetical protein [Kiritimatiellota bacterium]
MYTATSSSAFGDRKDVCTFAAVLAAAVAVAFSGLGDELPIDGHEALVARTADCMIQRRSMLTPILNNAYRLNKPPLNYWLAILADRLVYPDGRVSPFEARLPSALGGLLMACGVWIAGRVLYDRWTGLAAGFATTSSFGFAGYTHSAIPEMLYSGLCTAGLAAFIVAEFDRRKQRPRWAVSTNVMLGWLFLGLAGLAKGPQLPIIIVLGLWGFNARASGWRVASRNLQVAVGFPLFLVVWGWWYVYIAATVPQTDAVMVGGQLSKHWLPQLASLWRWCLPYPYYPVRAATLAAPWLVPYALGVVAPWLPGVNPDRATKRLWWLVVVAMAILSVPAHRRWYYLMPLLGVICLVSLVAFRAWGHSWGNRHPRGWRTLLGVHALLLGLACPLLAVQIGGKAPALSWGAAAMLAAACLFVAALLVCPTLPFLPNTQVEARIVLLLFCGVIVVSLALRNGKLLATDRSLVRRAFLARVGNEVAPADALFAGRGSWKVAQYYLHRDIPEPQPAKVRQAIKRERTVWLIDLDAAGPALEFRTHRLLYAVVLQTHGYRLLRVTAAAPVAEKPDSGPDGGAHGAGASRGESPNRPDNPAK